MIHQASTSEHWITVEKSTSKESVPTTPQAEKKLLMPLSATSSTQEH